MILVAGVEQAQNKKEEREKRSPTSFRAAACACLGLLTSFAIVVAYYIHNHGFIRLFTDLFSNDCFGSSALIVRGFLACCVLA